MRPGTEYAEVIEIKRSFIHPLYKFPLSYNDISLSEVGRRILFDFDKYGDSPACLDQGKNPPDFWFKRTGTIQER